MEAKIANGGMLHDVDWLKQAHATKEADESIEGFWYLATPYSKYEFGQVAAFTAACEATATLIKRGLRVYSPIAHAHPIAVIGGLDQFDDALWADQLEPMERAAYGLFVLELPGWDVSKGVTREINNFKRMGKTIKYLSYPGLAVKL